MPSFSYDVGFVLDSGAKLVKRLGKASLKAHHYRWELLCPCGDPFVRATYYFTQGVPVLCDKCAKVARALRINGPIVPPRYVVGTKVNGVEVLSIKQGQRGSITYQVKCECEAVFSLSERVLDSRKRACGACRALVHESGKDCHLCGR